jgi:hypothetical protein
LGDFWRCEPQRLKPVFPVMVCGTTEVVPSLKRAALTRLCGESSLISEIRVLISGFVAAVRAPDFEAAFREFRFHRQKEIFDGAVFDF